MEENIGSLGLRGASGEARIAPAAGRTPLTRDLNSTPAGAWREIGGCERPEAPHPAAPRNRRISAEFARHLPVAIRRALASGGPLRVICGVAPAELLAELLRVAEAIGLEVRCFGLRRKNAGAGGLCTLNGRAVVILNLQTSAIDRGTALADALAGRDLSDVPMRSRARAFIAARTRARSRLLSPFRGPGPGLARCPNELGRRQNGKS